MIYKKFSEFVALREAGFIPPQTTAQTQQAAANPAVRNAVQNNLMAAMKAPPPPGMNPAQYQGKIRNAINIAKTTGAPSASAAMDTANAANKASQQ